MTLLGQSQDARDGAVAVQASGDVTVNFGLSVPDVRALVDTFLQTSLPALQEAARAEARRNTEVFLNEFVRQLGATSRVSADEFAKPDAQASLSEALKGCALKGEDADVALVSRLLIERLSAAGKPLLKLVCEQAIRVLPNLTKPQIAYLAFMQYTKSVKHNGLDALSTLEALHALLLPLVEPGFQLSPANRQYLASHGLMVINPVADANLLPQNMRTSYPFLPPTDDEIATQGGHSIFKFMQEYAAVEGPTSYLTSTGQLIGMQHLSAALGTVNMEIWIK
jgi:hypothetical protein